MSRKKKAIAAIVLIVIIAAVAAWVLLAPKSKIRQAEDLVSEQLGNPDSISFQLTSYKEENGIVCGQIKTAGTEGFRGFAVNMENKKVIITPAPDAKNIDPFLALGEFFAWNEICKGTPSQEEVGKKLQELENAMKEMVNDPALAPVDEPMAPTTQAPLPAVAPMTE